MQEQNRKKKQYQKPEIKKVDLRPAEAVLADCKTALVNGANPGNNCSTPSNCSTLGS